MTAGIIVTHGALAEELLGTARLILGDFSHCHGVTNSHKSPQTLYDEILLLLESEKGNPCIIFVDYFGGSCSHACLRIEIAHPDIRVISGVNLPMLLAFVNKRDTLPPDDLTAEIVKRGQDSIKVLDPSKI
ncbi:MAG: PTS sugar transporter subunit IIA [Candidatus Krumholzibacteriia bacterium]